MNSKESGTYPERVAWIKPSANVPLEEIWRVNGPLEGRQRKNSFVVVKSVEIQKENFPRGSENGQRPPGNGSNAKSANSKKTHGRYSLFELHCQKILLANVDPRSSNVSRRLAMGALQKKLRLISMPRKSS